MQTWRIILIAALSLNAVLGFGYRVYRLTKGGPLGDVVGQAILGLILAGLAVGVAAEVAAEVAWLRWVALVYALAFGLLVMPFWTLAVLIPLKPGKIDYAFAIIYWIDLALITVTAVAI
ncbi:MAG TPA: hypothetical protein VEV82_07605 [Actinomycetota bacterium]|nr:hypothetical protein [Actinomycetota bacterium]